MARQLDHMCRFYLRVYYRTATEREGPNHSPYFKTLPQALDGYCSISHSSVPILEVVGGGVEKILFSEAKISISFLEEF